MNRTRLSTEGHVIIPPPLHEAHHWEPGQEFVAIDTEDGILLKPQKPFSETTLEEVAGCLTYDGPAKSLQDFEDAIAEAIQSKWKK